MKARIVTSSIGLAFRRLWKELENPDAMVTESIDSLTHHLATAKVELKRVQRDHDALKSRREAITQECAQWRERAMREASINKSRALECIKRMEMLSEELNRTIALESNHHKALAELSSDIEKLERARDDVKRNQNMLRARQSRAYARNAIEQSPYSPVDQAHTLLEEWEARVSYSESTTESLRPCTDTLASEFLNEEESQRLEEKLKSIINEG
jgi:phage shock protein A